MKQKRHWAVLIDNNSDKVGFVKSILNNDPPNGFERLKGLKGYLFSKLTLEQFIDEEDRHGLKILSKERLQPLKTMSSGERKKALLKHILKNNPDYVLLDNPFDNLDIESQTDLKIKLQACKDAILLVQFFSRRSDLLPFIDSHYKLNGRDLIPLKKTNLQLSGETDKFHGNIPPPIQKLPHADEVLIELKNVSVSYLEKPILKNINWKINKGDFWELKGKNGSGKTTILSMITGENPKGYGQELYIFGRKKGSGESVWDIKKRIGYFTPSMTDKFTGYHSVENMVISGLNDSIGLYIRPTEAQLRTASEWLHLIGMGHQRNNLFHDLTMGQKRLVMCVRAMIKHPVLLIFDEPTAGLDDASAALFVNLVNKFAGDSESTIIFVSHRKEPNLSPDFVYELKITEHGSIGGVQESLSASN